MRKLNLGQDDPSKPLLTLIIERLVSGSLGSGGSQVQPQKPSVEEPKSIKVTKEKESIESSLNDLKKQSDKSKEFIQQAKETPSLTLSNQQKEKETSEPKEPSKEFADIKHDSGKFVAAKKEAEPSPIQSQTKDDKKKHEKSEDSLPGKKFQTVPDDAMKRKPEPAAKHGHQVEADGNLK